MMYVGATVLTEDSGELCNRKPVQVSFATEAGGFITRPIGHGDISVHDLAISAWLMGQGGSRVRPFVAVGWATGMYLLLWLRAYLPKSSLLLDPHNVISLATLCLTLDEVDGVPWRVWQERAFRYAAVHLKRAGLEPDGPGSAYEALANLHAWRYLTSQIQAGVLAS